MAHGKSILEVMAPGWEFLGAIIVGLWPSTMQPPNSACAEVGRLQSTLLERAIQIESGAATRAQLEDEVLKTKHFGVAVVRPEVPMLSCHSQLQPQNSAYAEVCSLQAALLERTGQIESGAATHAESEAEVLNTELG